uniref:Uncharacterized protein n=1 Tax=viral metagenome TaxID=1070528 RepID=A0A6M3Y261_9ZZZZ
MISVIANTPTHLWLGLGEKFFSKDYEKMIDIKLGDRRFVSIGNTLIVKDWPKEWTGQALFGLVGYSPKGYKMSVLRETYIPDQPWYDFLNALDPAENPEVNKKGFSIWGMNCNMKREGKGGCLSSIHLLRNRGRNILFVHGKIAEIPRKFVADLLLVRDILQELSLWPMEVRFMYSTVYYSIVGLRTFIPVLGEKHVQLHGLPITTPRNYQAGIIEAINKYSSQFSKKERRNGLWTLMNLTTGEWIDKRIT